eukprot:4701494-Pyramimonas_sp.AAC.1
MLAPAHRRIRAPASSAPRSFLGGGGAGTPVPFRSPSISIPAAFPCTGGAIGPTPGRFAPAALAVRCAAALDCPPKISTRSYTSMYTFIFSSACQCAVSAGCSTTLASSSSRRRRCSWPSTELAHADT